MDIYDLLKSNKIKFIDNGAEIKCDEWLIQNKNNKTEIHLLINGEWHELFSNSEDDCIEVVLNRKGE